MVLGGKRILLQRAFKKTIRIAAGEVTVILIRLCVSELTISAFKFCSLTCRKHLDISLQERNSQQE